MKKKLVQYGAGNIGRGFIGDLFSRAGYEVVFIDVQKPVIEQFNRDREYPVRYVSEVGNNEYTVTGVRAVDGTDLTAVEDEIATADCMATAVGVSVLPHIIKPVAAGLRKRWASKNYSPLNFIICENLLDADKFMRKLFHENFSEDEQKKFDELVGLVEASIGRMVPVMTPEAQSGNILRICVEKYAELPIDKDGMKCDIPNVPGLIPASPFAFYIRRKLFLHNMGHALTAYLGWLNKDTYIAESIRNPYIRLIVSGAMRQSARALSKSYNIELGAVLDHADDLIERFHNSALKDTNERVGRDPIRKLALSDRLSGAAAFCHKQDLPFTYIAVGIAAGLLYDNDEDNSSLKIKAEIKQKGLEEALNDYCGINIKSEIGQPVSMFYEMLKSGQALDVILRKADTLI